MKPDEIISDLRELMTRDILYRKDIESLLHRSEERYRKLFEASRDAIYFSSANGRFTDFNQAALDLFGYNRSELLQLNVLQIYADPSDRERFQIEIEKRGAVQAFEVMLINKAGEKFPCWLTSNARYGRKGEITGYQGIIHDLTEKRKLELERDRFFTQTKELICILGADGTYKRINPAFSEVLNCDEQELLSGSFLDLILEDEREVVKHLLASLGDGAERTIFECHVCAKAGVSRLVEWRVSPDPLTELYYAVGSDITDQKQNEELQRERDLAARSAEIKSSFLANMSHEIRTLLSAVTGMTHLLRQTELSPKQIEYIRALESSSEHLMQLINDILDISKIEAGKLKLEEREFSLNNLVNTLIQSMKFRAAEKKLKLHLEFAPEVPEHYLGDGFRLNQILMNLLGNAIKFTSEGSVTLRVDSEAHTNEHTMLRIEVQDTGIGISAEQQKMIFQSFNQANEGVSRNYGGTGLGLAIVRQLVGMMNGFVSVKSHPGEGSTFQLRLPLRMTKSQKLPADLIVEEEHLADLSGVTVLLVEDNKVNRLIAGEMITNRWPKIILHQANDGIQAIDMTDQYDYDLIIMDLMMPELDGLSCTRILRSRERTSQIPILALSALAGKTERVKCEQAGMNDYLPKPVQPKKLFASMVRLCGFQAAENSSETGRDEVDVSAFASLDYLEKITGGNKNLISRTLGIIRDESPPVIERLRISAASGDARRVAAIAHKLRSSMQFVNNTELCERLRNLEEHCRSNEAERLTEIDVESIANDCMGSIGMIGELLENLNN